MTSRLLKFLVLLAVASLVAGCKLVVMVPSGGDVTSASGTRNCSGGSLCEHNITDSTFNESFTAVARPGYVFTKWNKGAGFQCGDSTNPMCKISNVGTGGIVGIGAYIAGGSFSYAMPLFEFVGIDTDGDGTKNHLDTDDDNDGVLDADDACPLVGPNLDGFGCAYVSTVAANGKIWFQPDLFAGLSWNQMNAVCPGGICANNGVLNGHNMTGWKWASNAEVAALFNSYGVSPPFSPDGGGGIELYGAQWHAVFKGPGWRFGMNCYSMLTCFEWINAATSTLSSSNGIRFGEIRLYPSDLAEFNGVDAVILISNKYGTNDPLSAAWFYRTP